VDKKEGIPFFSEDIRRMQPFYRKLCYICN